MSKKLSIIIVTYNSENLIFDCLDSIFKHNDIGDFLEVIVVDNCSNDQDRVFDKIREIYSSKVVLIKNTVNKGYGHGNNLGVRVSTSSRFIVMNPDVRIVEPVFQKILEKFTANKNIGMIGVRFIDGSCMLYFKPEYITLFRAIFFKMYIKFNLYKIEEMYFSGSFLAFDKKSFIDAGLFDENIFLYYEEADISNRILGQGKQTILAKDIYVKHLAHGRTINPYLLQVEFDSLIYYSKKYKCELNKIRQISLIVFRLKYYISFLLGNKHKKNEFKARINVLSYKYKY